jgi:FixJ family two-component response regulator
MVKKTYKHIYFLDDDPAIHEDAREILEKASFKVSCYSDPVECLAQLRSNHCDLLITELKIRGVEGIELIRDIKHFAPWIPVVILTGDEDVPSAVNALKTGAVDVLEKPLDKKDFARKIASIVKENVTHPILGTPLTQQEMKILQLIIDGKSNNEIAHMFQRSICTIEYHRARIMNKLGVDNTINLVKRVLSMGLIDLNEIQFSDEKKPDSEKA